jgi:hypothetical protein
MGNGPAAIVANNMRRSFPIKFGLMVGVGGGVWSKKDDIRLGDVVVSRRRSGPAPSGRCLGFPRGRSASVLCPP